METRLAVIEDALLLAALHAASFTHGVWNRPQITDSLANAAVLTWVVTEKGDIKGFAMLQQAANEAEILTLCAAPAARRQGIADALLNQILVHARAAHISKIFLEVAEDNTPAQKLYEKHGFKMTGKRPRYYQRDTGAVDALMLTLEIV